MSHSLTPTILGAAISGKAADKARRTDSKENSAILRVAYLLAAADGDVSNDEIATFKQTMSLLEGFEMGSQETTSFIESCIEDGRKLMALRHFYADEELVKAFLTKVVSDVRSLCWNKFAVRKAFAVWIAICIADGEYSSFERMLIKRLQNVSSWNTSGLAMLCCLKAPAEPEKMITDEFLSELEERITSIHEMQEQLSSCEDAVQKQSLLESIDYLVQSLDEYIHDDGDDIGYGNEE